MAKRNETLDPFAYLEDDHKRVKGLFAEIDEAEDDDARLEIFEDLKEAITLHSELEEQFLYPVLAKKDKTHDSALEGVEEHKEVKTLLDELSALTPSDEEWKPKLTVLEEDVDHHVKEEEGKMFKEAKSALDDDEITAIGKGMEDYLEESI